MKFILLVLASSLFSCGANYHLRKSSEHLRKAILKGAKVKSDTIRTVVPFKFPGVSYHVELKPLNGYVDVSKPIEIEENGVSTSVDIGLKEGCPEDCIETVVVKTDCPPYEGKVEVPTAINNTIVTPKGFWYYFQFYVLSFFLGFAACFFRGEIKTLFLKLKP